MDRPCNAREKYPALYSIVRHKTDTIAKGLKSSPPNMKFREISWGPRLASWNALPYRLTFVQLIHGTHEFR
jgi:hypothetical protein